MSTYPTYFIYFNNPASVLYDSYISVVVKKSRVKLEAVRRLLDLLSIDNMNHNPSITYLKPNWQTTEMNMTEVFTWDTAIGRLDESQPSVFWCGRSTIMLRRDDPKCSVALTPDDIVGWAGFGHLVKELQRRYGYNTLRDEKLT